MAPIVDETPRDHQDAFSAMLATRELGTDVPGKTADRSGSLYAEEELSSRSQRTEKFIRLASQEDK